MQTWKSDVCCPHDKAQAAPVATECCHRRLWSGDATDRQPCAGRRGESASCTIACVPAGCVHPDTSSACACLPTQSCPCTHAAAGSRAGSPTHPAASSFSHPAASSRASAGSRAACVHPDTSGSSAGSRAASADPDTSSASASSRATHVHPDAFCASGSTGTDLCHRAEGPRGSGNRRA